MMSNRTTRRDALKGLAGLTVGTGMTGWAQRASASAGATAAAIDVRTPPPGPRSLALLEKLKSHIGRSNYTGL